MAFFSSFTDSIRQKWLQFFQVNRDWITLHMEVESVYTPDGGKRPPSYLILGVVNALEPKLAQLMMPFSKLNADADTLIEVLELHFDPDIVLGNRLSNPPVEPETNQEESTIVLPDDNVDDETLAISHLNGFGLDASELKDKEPNQELNDVSLSNEQNGKHEPQAAMPLATSSTNALETDDFGDVSFKSDTTSATKLDEEILGDLNPPDENAFNDVLSDVWGDETGLQKGEENNDFLGEELPTGVFDDSEIARLFPNS
ncbi:DUF5331 domain-containing protein [Nostoc sp. FACHB-87]|uniref:DUF5331 domain-containing protein n=1 Tax=Nostocaceae TaxID=1162 RepID=UPI001688E45F|nr:MULTISPECIES: DUF5331 domain-containing protein [Nostocaceae]MBD2302944.1 DUF5331 domain-containing protein [Nostoc sp. FACHB-190]MBD2455829.1 DUF5331 domain-containing protein [Nostoc sp. FACHB-87]MBD2478415.1 DUF5331 domain-containing protein [Anabaena sp. FACHB-83]